LSSVGTYSLSATCTIDGCTSDASEAVSAQIKAKPTAPTIQGSGIVCSPATVTLTANGCAGSVTWSDNSTGTSLSLSSVGTYSLSATCTIDGCTSEASEAVSAQIKAKPTAPTIQGATSVCSPATVTLTANGCAGTVTWSDNSTGTSLSLSSVGTYSLSATCTIDGCTSDASEAVSAQIKAKPAAPTIQGATSVCSPATITLTANGCAGTVTWSNNATGSELLVSQVGTYAYTASCTINGCTSDNSNAATGTIYAKPGQPVISPQTNTICKGTSATLSVSCPNMTINWSNGATTSTITVSPQTTTSYTVSCTSANGCISPISSAATITVVDLPAKPAITAGATTICSGSSITLTASACNGGTLRWTGGLTGNSILVTPANTSTYRVVCRTSSGCQSDSSDAFTPTLIPIPTMPTVQNKLISAGTSATLTASCTSGTPVWYGSASGTAMLASGTYTTPVISQNTDYYVSCGTNPGSTPDCQSSRVVQTVSVDKFAITRQPEDAAICAGQNANFSISASGSGITYQWQENRGSGWQNISNGGVYSGATTSALKLTAPAASSNGYLYRCIITNTFPGGVPVNETSASALLTVSNSAASNTLSIVTRLAGVVNTYQATSAITATNIIESNSRVNYFAGGSVILNPGFEVKAGSYFQAKIQAPCSN
jgi:hypothetical protein